MISFDNIDKFSRRYDIYMRYLCFAHNYIYYRNFYVINQENMPPKGQPTIVIANHQNGLMDALAILHTMYKDRRQPVFIARGDIFKKNGVARILRFLKIMPTFRTRDGGVQDIKSNLAIFNRAARVLRKGGTLVIFPEAAHQHGHYMSTFKKGFARIAFSAEELNDFQLGLQVLPLNIHYSNYFSFRSDLMVTIGKPFTFEELFDLYKENPNQAYLALNEKARARVKELTPDIDIPEYYNEIEALTQMMSRPLLKHKKLRANYLPNQKDAAMTIIADLKNFKEESPDDFVRLMDETREYTTLLDKLFLHNWIINRRLSVFRLLFRTLWELLALPIYIFGFVNNFIPLFIVKHFTKKVKDPMLHSTFQYILGGIVCFPIYYIILFFVVFAISKDALFALDYFIVSFLCVFVIHSYQRSVRKLLTYFRGLKLKNTRNYQTLCDLKHQILTTMGKIVF